MWCLVRQGHHRSPGFLRTVLADVLSTFVGKHPTPYLDKFTEPGGQFNDTEVGLRKGRTMPEVLDEFNDAHAQVMSLAAQIPREIVPPQRNPPLVWHGVCPG